MPLESNSAASVSPVLVFETENGATFTFNFQMDGRLTIIGLQEGRAVTGALTEEQTAELRDSITETSQPTQQHDGAPSPTRRAHHKEKKKKKKHRPPTTEYIHKRKG